MCYQQHVFFTHIFCSSYFLNCSFLPILCHWSLSIFTESIRKSFFSDVFRGYRKSGILGSSCFHSKLIVANTCDFKGAPKIDFMHYQGVVIILFNADLYKSSFSTYSIKKQVFNLSVFCVFYLFYFEFVAIFIDFLYSIYIIIVYIGQK